MAQSILITAANLKGRINGVAEDAKKAKMQADALGSGYKGQEEVKMAAQIILEAQKKAVAYLDRVEKMLVR